MCCAQSLFGKAPHIKMLGIYLLATNKPSKALFRKRASAVDNDGLNSITVIMDLEDQTTCSGFLMLGLGLGC